MNDTTKRVALAVACGIALIAVTLTVLSVAFDITAAGHTLAYWLATPWWL